MADDSFEEPFDSAGPSRAKSPSSTPNAPPSFAFGHGGSLNTSGSVPPAAAFASASMAPPQGNESDDEGPLVVGVARSSEPSVLSTQLNERWREYDKTTPTDISTPEQLPPAVSEKPTTSSDLGPRQAYSFRPSSSYDTDELIRKYGGMAGVSATTISPRRASPPSAPRPIRSPADVRDQALKMLELVDDYNIRRTESGGFRATLSPNQDDPEPFSFRRSSSSAGKRVPSALSGLNFSTKPTTATNSWKEQSGRVSFSDPSFRDDDNISDDEDNILRSDGGFHDEPVVDVIGMENRAAGMRAYSDDKSFEGDFDGGSKAWSSRYSDNPYISRAHVLDQWDREFDQEKGRKSARNMFMSTASDIRSSASNVLKGASNQKQKIFGSGGFSFRANHVFGNHRAAASERDEVSLRAAWREVDDATNVPPVHKTWQEVMLNKQKRRRILFIILFVFLGVVATLSSIKAIKRARARASMSGTSNIGQSVTFYVTSDTPYDAAAEERLQKDLVNIPTDSEFIVHLGNIQDAAVTMCPKTRYSDAAAVLQKSPVPLFIIPGAEDWVKCPNPMDRFDRWLATFQDFDLSFKHPIAVKRDNANPETFSFLHKGVLFMGMHIVSGPVVDDEAWRNREKDMLKFYFGMANVNKGAFRFIVLLGNAKPSPQQEQFFDALLSNLKAQHGPLIYIHANQKGDSVLEYNPFADHDDVFVVGVPDGRSQPPLKITVGFGERPLLVG